MRTTSLRVLIAGAAVLLAAAVFLLRDLLPDRLRAGLGCACFLALAVSCSADVRAIRWRTVGWGIGLQLLIAVLILRFEVGGVRPGYQLFSMLAAIVTQFLDFTNAGSRLVFGVLSDPDAMGRVFPDGLVMAFAALPVIIFVSSVFTVLYHLGVLQLLVTLMARLMMPLMAHQRRGNAVRCGQRVHGPDRSAHHRQAVHRRHDPLRAVDAHDRRAGHDRRQRARRLPQPRRRPGGGC